VEYYTQKYKHACNNLLVNVKQLLVNCCEWKQALLFPAVIWCACGRCCCPDLGCRLVAAAAPPFLLLFLCPLAVVGRRSSSPFCVVGGGFFFSSSRVGVGVGVGVVKMALTVPPAVSRAFLSWTCAERLGGAGRGGARGGKLAGSHTERCGPVK
jgi:hypothetical protein